MAETKNRLQRPLVQDYNTIQYKTRQYNLIEPQGQFKMWSTGQNYFGAVEDH